MTWKTMDSAPTDGSYFIAVEYTLWGSDVGHMKYPHRYKWDGAPNYWHSRENGVCIRPEYQDRYRWVELPNE